ncbi:MAG: hypothetical protein V3S36_06125, partial [Acidiferrobacterales bacterium]
ITAGELRSAEEVFLSSTAGGIMPVARIDGHAAAGGAPGPVTRQIKDRYWALHDDPAYTTPIKYNLAAA